MKRHSTSVVTGAKGTNASGFQTKKPSTSKVVAKPPKKQTLTTTDLDDRVSKKPGEKMQKANYTE